jgi:hypothetical protein
MLLALQKHASRFDANELFGQEERPGQMSG